MEQVLTLLLVLVGGTHAFLPAADTKCHVTHNTSLCPAIVGGSVYIQVMTSVSGLQVLCKKELPGGAVNVFSLRKDQVTVQPAFRIRTQFLINNGTLKIINLHKNDSGRYNVEVYNSDGVLVRHMTITLDVQENLSKVGILVSCAVGALLVVMVIICCVWWKMRRNKRSSGIHQTSGFSTSLTSQEATADRL